MSPIGDVTDVAKVLVGEDTSFITTDAFYMASLAIRLPLITIECKRYGLQNDDFMALLPTLHHVVYPPP